MLRVKTRSFPGEAKPERSVVTWGMFDGVHLGHQALLGVLRDTATRLNAQAGVVTFDPHPAVHLHGLQVDVLTPVEHKLNLLECYGVDWSWVVPFSNDIAAMSPETFVEQVVVEPVNAVGIVLGWDAVFGQGREGDIETLREICEARGLELEVVEPHCLEGGPVKSSRVRDAVREGRVEDLPQLLGREHSMSGTVVSGDGRGRQIGIPTINLDVGAALTPPFGVYGVELAGKETWQAGMMNIGARPTFKNTDAAPTVEIHLLDPVELPSTGNDVVIRLLARIRDEQKFNGAEELVEQIGRDRALFVEWLSRHREANF